MKKTRSRRTASTAGPGVRGMGKEIGGLAERVMRQFRKAHPEGDQYEFRDRAARIFSEALTRRIRGKRRGDSMITRAERMWRRQLAEKRRGKRSRVNWYPIALACISGFSLMSDPERKKSLRRLRDSVYNRNCRAMKRARRAGMERQEAHDTPKTG